ncbi:MAG: zinc-dependent alcohol dehydrogenase family protein [Pseudomonadota bacterium]
MKQVVSYGRGPTDVELVDAPLRPPGAGELALELIAAPVHPANLLQMEGRYGVARPGPFGLGAEGAFRVVESMTEGFDVGDVVLAMSGECWTEAMTARARSVTKVSRDVDVEQASMMRANPGTALAMLRDIVDLKPGDWVAQNAANSSVGVNVVKIAKARGLKTLNVVRRESAVQPLLDLGADIVLAADDSAPKTDQQASIAFDAIGGRATGALSAMAGYGGTVVTYGVLSGEECALSPHDIVFRGVSLTGFWLAEWYGGATPEKIVAHHAELEGLMRDGVIGAAVAARYPLAEIGKAVAHASEGGRDGKILLTGPAYEG